MRIVLLVTAALLAVHGDEAPSGVTELTADSWESTVPSSNLVWAVKFHSEMCGSCKEFIPAWDEARASKALKGLHWGVVNIDSRAGQELASRFGVLDDGIPNVRIFNQVKRALPNGDAVVSGEVISAKKLKSRLKKQLKDWKMEGGFYVRDEL